MNDAETLQQSIADAAPGKPRDDDHDVNTPHARRIDPNEVSDDQLSEKAAAAEDRQEALVDEGVEETFPASDPVSAKRIT